MPNLLLLSLLAAFPPMSIDMYLPAIPTLQEEWGLSHAQVNLSLVIYFVSFSFFLLIHGPLSDRFGRRPVLVGGILTFIAGCLLCASATNITFLVAARALQAAGAASASALALALSKDLYEGTQRQKVLGYIGVIMAFCPMFAPTVGGLMLAFASWQWIFISQGVLALVGLYGVYRLKEPLTEFTSGGVLAVAGRYVSVLKNGRFVIMALAFAFVVLPHFGFIGGSPAIYISGFEMSEQMFGVYFGLNALGFMIGSFACTRFGENFKQTHILYVSLIGVLGAGILLLVLGRTSPLSVALPMILCTFSVGFSRPVANSLTLDQVDTDIGAASSVMTFVMFLFGALSMEIIALDWDSKVAVLGILGLCGAGVPLLALIGMRASAKTKF